jgi:hypothetical protein
VGKINRKLKGMDTHRAHQNPDPKNRKPLYSCIEF